jgi:uridine kinase
LFFIDPKLCPPEANFCDPRYLELDEFIAAAQGLSNGKSVEVPVIDFKTFQRTGMATLQPARYVLIEGMTIYRIPEVDELFDLRFYVAAPFHVLEARKRLRDSTERNKPASVIEAQLRWMRTEHDTDLETLQEKVVMLSEPNLEDLVMTVVERAKAIDK